MAHLEENFQRIKTAFLELEENHLGDRTGRWEYPIAVFMPSEDNRNIKIRLRTDLVLHNRRALPSIGERVKKLVHAMAVAGFRPINEKNSGFHYLIANTPQNAAAIEEACGLSLVKENKANVRPEGLVIMRVGGVRP